MHKQCLTLLFYPQEEGVMFELGAESQAFRGTITLVVGDNLGSQHIGGYKQLASALSRKYVYIKGN